MMFFYQFVEVFGQFGKFPFQLKMSSKSPDIQNRVVQNHFQELKFKHSKLNHMGQLIILKLYIYICKYAS